MMSWRDNIKIHPACDMFPMLADDELVALGEDIRVNGLRTEIAIKVENGRLTLLDGRNRLDAMERVGMFVEFTTMRGEHYYVCTENPGHIGHVTVVKDDPVAYIISANIHRRHLTVDQKREMIAKLLKAAPEKSDRQIAETVKASPTTVGKVRATMEATGDVSKLDTRKDTKGRHQPASKPKPAAKPKVKAEPQAPDRFDVIAYIIGDEPIAPVVPSQPEAPQTAGTLVWNEIACPPVPCYKARATLPDGRRCMVGTLVSYVFVVDGEEHVIADTIEDALALAQAHADKGKAEAA